MASRAVHNMHNHHAHLHKRTPHAHQSHESTQVVSFDVPTPILRRAPAESTCGVAGTADCTTIAQKESNTNLTIAVATAVPLTVIVIVLIFLHRRIKYRMRREDANDKHKSLDFGLDDVPGIKSKKGGRKGPEMSVNTLQAGRNRGLSMDMHLASPYLLPDGMNGSRDSFNSLSRAHHDANDPYRPVHMSMSMASDRAPSRLYGDNGSFQRGHLEKPGDHQRAGLLSHGTSLSSRDSPDVTQDPRNPFADSPASSEHPLPVPPPPPRAASRQRPAQGTDRWYPSDDKRYGLDSSPDLSVQAPQTPQDILSDKAALPAFPQDRKLPSPPPQEWNEKQPTLPDIVPSRESVQDALRITVPEPTHGRQNSLRLPTRQASPIREQPDHTTLPLPPVPDHAPEPQSTGLSVPQQSDPRRVSVMGMRPLPPDDPTDNPEQRANRIRSFYREYFDETRPNPPGQYPVGHNEYVDYDDGYENYLDDGAVYDPETGAFFYTQPNQPYVQAMPRRAMTPPPRHRDAASAGHRSIMSTQSAGRPIFKPKKRAPPPKPLSSLPTPHLIRDDTSILTDFAPPTTFRDRQLGRGPDSPLGTSRPFSPAYRAHTPIASSFDDLAVMPSPHALRKSGTFTALDFAPPPRFRERGETMSETGSIRSNRSGMSALQRDAIRAGAYRLSRLPKDTVGSQSDLKLSLKPQWDMNR